MGTKKESLKQFYKFATHDIWHITETELSKGKRIIYRIVKITVLSVRGFFRDDLNIKASALSFSLLFAIVPIIALILAISKGFGFENIIEDSLNSSILGSSDVVPVIMGFVERYLETARGGVFVGVGMIALLYSVYMFFQQVEASFNSIWQVKKSRSYTRQFTTYFSILLVLPMLLVISSGLSIFINSVVENLNFLSPIFEFGFKILPAVMMWIIFTLLYLIIPNTKVNFTSAAISGVIAGSVFQLFQLLYIWGQVYLARYNAVYGGFAAIPLLLLWLQISSLIMLLGAEISFLTQNIRNFDYEVDTQNISRRYKDYISLYITYLIVKRFEKGEPPITIKEIVEENHLPIRLVSRIMQQLVDSGILIEVYNEHILDKSYQPIMDINKMTMSVFSGKIESFGSELFLNNKTDEMKAFWKKSLEIKKELDSKSDNILIKDLLL